jgi:hypothetical protein
VECLILGKREMQWAITHDDQIRTDLQTDMRNRRVQTVASLESFSGSPKGSFSGSFSDLRRGSQTSDTNNADTPDITPTPSFTSVDAPVEKDVRL